LDPTGTPGGGQCAAAELAEGDLSELSLSMT
jgi:hypothetical protein